MGWRALEPVLLAALALEVPVLLVGPHGTAKSLLIERLAGALGLAFRHYNASLLSYDDLIGIPMPDESGTGMGLPSELETHLKKLVPQFEFTSVGFSLIRTSVDGGELKLSVATDGKVQYQLSFYPVAFDPRTGSMTVRQCSLVKHFTHTTSKQAGAFSLEKTSEEVFSTSAILRGGEYTVLGATGREPIFLVLQLTTL